MKCIIIYICKIFDNNIFLQHPSNNSSLSDFSISSALSSNQNCPVFYFPPPRHNYSFKSLILSESIQQTNFSDPDFCLHLQQSAEFCSSNIEFMFVFNFDQKKNSPNSSSLHLQVVSVPVIFTRLLENLLSEQVFPMNSISLRN